MFRSRVGVWCSVASCVIGASALFGAGSVAAASLRDAIALAVRHNPLILEAISNRRATDEELNQGRGLYLPRLDLEASSGFLYNHRPASGVTNDSRWGDSGSLVGRYTMFDGGYRQAEVDKQTARVAGAGYRVRERSELIAIQTLQAYLDILRFNQVLRLSEANVRVHRDFQALVQTRFRGGSSTQGEVFLANERVHGAEAIRADIKRTLGQAEAHYINLVGQRHPSLDPAPKPAGLPPTLMAALQRARSANPALIAAQKDVAVARAELAQSEAAFRPNVAVEARGSAGHDINAIQGPNHDASARFVLSWNLYDGRIKDARVRERIERIMEVEARLDRQRRDVDELVRRAWSDVKTNEERVAVLSRQVDTGARLIIAYRQEFEAGRRSILDLLESQNVHFGAQVQLITARQLVAFAGYQLIAAMGGMLDHFRIEVSEAADETAQPWNRDRATPEDLHPLLRR